MPKREKPFLTYPELIDKLKSKGMVINDADLAIHTLKKYGYYSLICGYKGPFKNKTTKQYIDGTRFEDIVKLYEFDKALREHFLHYLLLIEAKIKVAVAHCFSEKYTEQQEMYLNPKNYDFTTKRNKEDIAKLTDKLRMPIESYSYPYIMHAKIEHNNVPLWVLFNAISFGVVSKMYTLLPLDLKTTIAKEYARVKVPDLESMLLLTSRCRNKCAHGERLYSFHNKEALSAMPLHDKLKIPQKGSEYKYGQKDLFAVVIALRYLLDDSDFKTFKSELAKMIDKYVVNNSVGSNEDIFEAMGFPSNWKNITRYRNY
ncbi:MAG: Abi family protein [Selenomonadaceae bacterium]|nr:Abi family protein [Selenomonadaceae bacterium]